MRSILCSIQRYTQIVVPGSQCDPQRLRRAFSIAIFAPFHRSAAPSSIDTYSMLTTGDSRQRSALLVVLLCALLYVPPAVLTPFFTKGEPREALVVRRMVEEGDWLLPKRASSNGWTIASKPPFFHWLGAVASRLGGAPSEWSVRVPSVLLATVAVLAIGVVAYVPLGGLAALVAMLMTASAFEWVRAA